MSNAHADRLVERLSTTVLKIVWRQWETLGASLSREGRVSQSAIDLDALLLATAGLLEREPRLRDVIASWLTTCPGTLSVQRVRNLAKRFPAAVTSQLPTIAAVALDRGKDHRWKPLLTGTLSRRDFGDRGKDLVTPRTYRPSAAIIVQLRAGFGVGVKADALAYLLCVSSRGGGWATVGTIAEALDYSLAAVRRAADEMVDAHFLIAPDSADRHAPAPRMYRTDPTPWGTLLGLNSGVPRWIRWDQQFIFATKFFAWHEETAKRTVTDYAFATALRELLAEHPRAIETDNPDVPPMPAVAEEIIPYFEGRLADWENWAGQVG
ncbi:MAG: hypothetical protein ACHQXA_06110 [Gemmatimonadales bacterium]